MKLKSNHYYWIRLVTMYHGRGFPEKHTDPELSIGKYEVYNDGSGSSWNIVGSDEPYETYESDEKMSHRETCVIPLEEMEEISE